MKNKEVEAINKLNNLLSSLSPYDPFAKQIKNNVQILVQGLNNLDREFKQTTVELQSKDQKIGLLQGSIFDKEQKEFIEVLPQLYPNDYPINYNEWSNNLWGKQVLDRKDLNAIENNLPTFKAKLLKQEWIEVLHNRFPNNYPARFEDWNPNLWGKQVIDRNNIDTVKHWLPIYKQQLSEQLLAQQENQRALLSDKNQELVERNQEIERLKELLAIQEAKVEELLTQKEEESLLKNIAIDELISLQNLFQTSHIHANDAATQIDLVGYYVDYQEDSFN